MGLVGRIFSSSLFLKLGYIDGGTDTVALYCCAIA